MTLQPFLLPLIDQRLLWSFLRLAVIGFAGPSLRFHLLALLDFHLRTPCRLQDLPILHRTLPFSLSEAQKDPRFLPSHHLSCFRQNLFGSQDSFLLSLRIPIKC